jgi:rRNA maturation protein Nop10
MEAARALERPGDPAKSRSRRSQGFLAACSGISREAWNAKLAKFSPPDGRWTDKRRRELSEKNKRRARAAGLNVHDDRQMKERVRLAALINKEPLYGCSLRYSLRIAEDLKPDRSPRLVCMDCEDLIKAHKPVQLIKGRCPHHEFRDAQMFARGMQCPDCLKAGALYCDHIFDRTAKVNGDQPVMACVWHPRHPDANECLCSLGQLKLGFQEKCPHCGGRGYMIGLKWNNLDQKWEESFLDDGTRVFLSFLQQKGIRKWVLQKKQEDLAAEMGVHVNTFYAYRKKAEWLGYLKVVDGEIIRDCVSCGQEYIQSRDHGRREDGTKCRCGGTGPVRATRADKLMWKPDIILDQDFVSEENERFNASVRTMVDAAGPYESSRRRVAEDHAIAAKAILFALLTAWTGQQHTRLAFWTECRKQCAAQGIPEHVYAFLFPIKRE